ncbi:MAG TPA: DUF4870 domain-containing protein [Symbiobacteriaceae bacterium]|jgi:uncharacterized membrane protein|nr:DUF4870 domain-containing protein [Symbiobacteriaceae bacterium]
MANCPHCGVAHATGAKFCPGCGAHLRAALQGAQPQPTQTGLAPNIAGLLCYVFGWITGVVFYLIEKDRFVRFHAVQSIILFGGISILQLLLGWLPGYLSILALLIPVLWIVQIVAWILLMVKAYNNEMYKLPVIGDLAEKYSAQ